MDNLTITLNDAVRNATTTREVAIAAGAATALPTVADRYLPGAHLMVIADDTTWAIAGAQAQAQLEEQGVSTATALLLESHPRLKPCVEVAERIADHLRKTDAVPIAVGSGVVNDLVKYAAALAGKPYICVATAASMDGYAASGAALLQEGFKRTLACAPPLAIMADPAVLVASPKRMTAWGYGDLAGKAVAGADWLLADALDVEPINAGPFGLVQDNLATWLGQPRRLAAHEPEALAGLLGGLLVSGFAMQSHGNSRPASGSDHQFSHLWEMENLQVAGEPAAHGACVGVGCVAMLALYEWLLAQPVAAFKSMSAPEFKDSKAVAAEIEAALGTGEVARAARHEMAAKRAIGSRQARVDRFARLWPELRELVSGRLVGAAKMQQQLRSVGAAAHPWDLGISLPTLAADYRRARLVRRRYTLLDLLEDLCLLDRAVADLFTPTGFWGRSARFAANPNLETQE